MKAKVFSRGDAGRDARLRKRMATTLAVVGVTGLGLAAGGQAKAIKLTDLIEVNPEYEEYLNDVEAGNGEKWGRIPNKYKAQDWALEAYQNSLTDRGGEGETLPATFDLTTTDGGQYATKIKDQGLNGDCWAFATTTMLESRLKRQGIEYEFAPKQLDYLTVADSPYFEYLEDMGLLRSTRQLGQGGSFALVSYLLGGAYSPLKEADFFNTMKSNDSDLNRFTDWNDYNSLSVMGLLGSSVSTYQKSMSNDKLLSKEADYIVTEYRGFSGSATSVARIKSEVYNNGAVWVGTWWPDDADTTDACWDADHKTIIDKAVTCKTIGSGGHALTIVGWDDNYEYKDGATTKNGAFILQNSWGDWSEYTVESLIERQFLRSDLTEEQKEQVRTILNTTDTDKFVYLAYDFTIASTNVIDFGVVDTIEKNDTYDNIYDVADLKSMGTTSTARAATNDTVTLTYTTKDNAAENIEAVAVGVKAIALPEDATLIAYVEKSEGNFEKVGEVALPAGDYGQVKLDLDEAVAVKGDFEVRVQVQAGGDALEYLNEVPGLFTATVYTTEQEVEVPTTGTPEEENNTNEGGETQKEADKAPNTGWFTGASLGAKVAGVVLLVLTLVGTGFGIYAYRDRKHLFHKIDFKKK